MRAVIGHDRVNEEFYVWFQDGSVEPVDVAGPFPDEHDAVMAAHRSGFPVSWPGDIAVTFAPNPGLQARSGFVGNLHETDAP